MLDAWGCVQTKPGEHYKARSWIDHSGIETYLPLVRERIGTKLHLRPLFGCYLFVRMGPRWRKLLSTPGVAGVLMSGDEPAKLRVTQIKPATRKRPERRRVLDGESVVNRLRKMEDEGGAVVLPATPRYMREPYERGQILRVRQLDHVLHGRDLIFAGMRDSDRVTVLLAWFGQDRLLHLDARLVVAKTR